MKSNGGKSNTYHPCCGTDCIDIRRLEERLFEVMDALDEFAVFPSESARKAADAVMTINTCIPLHEAVNNMHDALRKRRRERDEALAEVRRLKCQHVYALVERDWYREACEKWLRHRPGCAVDIGDVSQCGCGLSKWLAEDVWRRKNVYEEE